MLVVDSFKNRQNDVHTRKAFENIAGSHRKCNAGAFKQLFRWNSKAVRDTNLPALALLNVVAETSATILWDFHTFMLLPYHQNFKQNWEQKNSHDMNASKLSYSLLFALIWIIFVL